MGNSFEATFVERIHTRATSDPATRAALRAGLGYPPEECHRMHRYLATWTTDMPPERETAFYTIASLVAHAKNLPDTAPRTFGGSLARSTLAPATAERYVHLLTQQSTETLMRYLATVGTSLVRENVPIDFAALLRDMSAWPWRRDDITKRWLQDYYRTTDLDTEDDQVNENTTEAS